MIRKIIMGWMGKRLTLSNAQIRGSGWETFFTPPEGYTH